MTFDEIRELIPHSFPILLVDRVISWEANTSIHTRKCVSGSDIILQGHFQAGPVIVPGVLLVEAIAQSALLLAVLSQEAKAKSTAHRLGEIHASFRTPVMVGDVLDIEVKYEQRVRNSTAYIGTGRVDGKLAVRARILSVTTTPDELEVVDES